MNEESGMVVSPHGDKYEVRWVEMYGGGTASARTFDTEEEAEAWIDGYNTGARENM